jgi:rhodanese-related sulfurtransferase
MEQVIQFITNHYWLVGAFVLTLGFVIYIETSAYFAPYKTLSPAQAVILQNHEGAVFVDIRENKELKAGKIIDSIHLPFTRFSTASSFLNKYRDKNIVIYCAAGNRSKSACARLMKEDYKKVFNLAGGINLWQKNSFPITYK